MNPQICSTAPGQCTANLNNHQRMARRRSAAGCAGLHLVVALLGIVAVADAQYSVDWSTVDGGGGTSTNGMYSVSGTIGQADAGTMNGGTYTLVGGFWGVVGTMQTPGAPYLSVMRTITSTVVVSWPKPAEGWILEYATALSSGTNAWASIVPPYQTNTTQLFFVEPTPTGNKFYRLHKP